MSILNFCYRGSVLSIIWLVIHTSGLSLEASESSQAYQIRVAALDIVGDSNELWIRTAAGKDPVKVALNTRTFSQPVKYRGKRVALFFKDRQQASAEDPGEPCARVVLPSQKSLILFQARDEGAGYQCYSIEEEGFPFGSFRMVNFSEDKVRVDIGNMKKVINAKKAATFSVRSDQRAMPVTIIARSSVTGESRYVRRSNWSLVPSQRELVLMFPNRRNGLIQMRHFVDTRVDEN